VVAGGVEGEVAEHIAGCGVDDAVEVVDEHDDEGAGVGASDADVKKSRQALSDSASGQTESATDPPQELFEYALTAGAADSTAPESRRPDLVQTVRANEIRARQAGRPSQRMRRVGARRLVTQRP
jgi:hypothetical protein